MKSLDLNQPNFSESLTKSLIYYLDAGFSLSGTTNTSGNLVKVAHPEYSDGQVWGTTKKNWSWTNPPVVYANNTLLSSGYSVNYKDGLIIFPSVKTSVFASYSYKQLLILDGLDISFFRGDSSSSEVYNGSFRPNSVQLPFLAVELGGSTNTPFELGNYSREVDQDILINVVTKDKQQCTLLSDILYNQVDDTFNLFDYKQSLMSGLIPLNDDGFLVNSSGTYNNLCATYPFSASFQRSARIDNTEKEPVRKLPNDLYHCTVRYEVSSLLKMSV